MAETVQTNSGITLEVFGGGPPPRSWAQEPGVTILSRGTLNLNRRAAEVLKFPEEIELLFSEQERVIGIRAARPDSPRSFALRPQGNDSSYQTSGKSFIDRYGIPHERSTRYKAEVDGDMLLVDLKQGGVDVSAKRRAKSGGGEEGG